MWVYVNRTQTKYKLCNHYTRINNYRITFVCLFIKYNSLSLTAQITKYYINSLYHFEIISVLSLKLSPKQIYFIDSLHHFVKELFSKIKRFLYICKSESKAVIHTALLFCFIAYFLLCLFRLILSKTKRKNLQRISAICKTVKTVCNIQFKVKLNIWLKLTI